MDYVVLHDFAVGIKSGMTVLYAADSSENSLLKSTNRGESWTHVLGSNQTAAVRCVATVRNNPDIVYAGVLYTGGGLQQGVYKSADGGQNWTHLQGLRSDIWVMRIAIHPSQPNIVWVGCQQDNEKGVVYRSTNGGDNWEGFSIGDPQNHFSVGDIALAQNPEKVWVAGYGSQDQYKGIWRTLDGGLSWEQRNAGIDPQNTRLTALAIDPIDSNILYAGNQAGLTMNVYKTVNGTTLCDWCAVSPSLPSGDYSISDVRVSPHNHESVYATTGLVNAAGIGVLCSTDAGASWQLIASDIAANSLDAVEIDPLEQNTIYIGGNGACYRSTNGGQTWAEKNIGALLRTVAITKVGKLSVCSSSEFVFTRTDPSPTWTVAYVEPGAHYNTPRLRDGAIRPSDSDVALFVGDESDFFSPQPFVLRSSDAGVTWDRVSLTTPIEAYGKSVCWHPLDPAVAYAAGYTDYNGLVWRSSDAGMSWTDPWLFPVWLQSVAASRTTLYAGGGNTYATVFKSTDDGTNWIEIRNGLPSASWVQSLSLDASSPKTVYAGTPMGVYKTDDGENWAAVNNGITYPNVSSVLMHPVTKNVVYAATNAGNQGHIYRSTSAGNSWSETFADGFPQTSVFDLTIDPNDPNTIYAATGGALGGMVGGVYHVPHIWTGELAVNTTWHSGETYLVDGTLTIAAGKSLTIEPGTTVNALANAKIRVEGTLVAVGNSESNIMFTSYAPSEQWQGIDAANAAANSVTLSYATISNANIGVNVGTHSGLTMNHCAITSAEFGVQIIPVGGGADIHKEINSCSFIDTRAEGIHVENFSDLTIRDDSLIGIGNKNGVSVRYSSPEVRNTVIESFNSGIYCRAKSSPVLQYAFNQIKFNRVGVQSVEGASPILGISNLLPGGMNSIFNNTEWDILLTGNSQVWAQGNWWGTREDPSKQFSVESGSRLIYDPWLEYDPNGEGKAVASGGSGKEDDGRMTVLPPIVRQVIIERLQNHYSQAMTLLRSIITDTSMPPVVRRWGVAHLLIVAQRMPTPNLSTYLVNLSNGNSWLAQEARANLPGSYLREGSTARAMAAYDQNIQQYPNSDLERDALYGKLLYALYNQGDLVQGQQLHDLLQSRYPNSYEAELAEVQLQHYRSGVMQRSSSGEPPLSKLNGQSTNLGRLPTEFALSQNYPNPFNPTTQLSFQLPEAGNVSLIVYDVLGRQVATLASGYREAGHHSVTWNASSEASGVYFARFNVMSANGKAMYSKINKLMLIR